MSDRSPQLRHLGMPAGSAFEPGRELRLLYVEDSAMDARLLLDMLDEVTLGAKFTITHVTTLEQACEAVAKKAFDCVLLDLGLPDGNGVDNVQRLLKINPQMTIVVMTGNTSDEASQQAIHGGAQEYLIKGQIEAEALTRLLRHAVQRNELLQQLKALREREYFLATHDVLTGLPNRQLFEDRASQILSRAGRANERLAICYLDIDGFKPVNDNFGHSVGDVLLHKIGEGMTEIVRDSDTVARVGGDEFVLMLYPLESNKQAQQVAERVIKNIESIDHIQDHPVSISASVGISLFPDHGRSLRQLQHRADIAMYYSKSRQRGGSAYFDEVMLGHAHKKQRLIFEIEEALRQSRFSAEYQPWVDTTNGQIQGLEVLLRWRSEDGEVRYPERFLEAARDSGQILKIATSITEQSITHWNEWRSKQLGPGQIALNLSLRELRDNNHLRELAVMLDRLRAPRHCVQLHLDANELTRLDAHTLRKQIEQLRATGYRLVLDRVTGAFNPNPSEFSMFDEVRLQAGDENIKALVEQARESKAVVVAVGLETREQVEQLRAIGCTLMQGFVFFRPLSADQVLRTLQL